MISAVLVGGDRVVANIEKMPARFDQEMRKGVARAALIVLRQTVQNKLQGQVLNVRTGRLQRSINASPVVEDDGVLVSKVGTNVRYARVHEYGFSGTVSVREHLRQSKQGRATSVRAHTRKVDLPARSFLRTALADMQGAVQRELQAAAEKAIKS